MGVTACSIPPNHLRLIALWGDPADRTKGMLYFDRNVRGLPPDVALWCGDRKGLLLPPVMASPSAVRVSFNTPLENGMAWSYDPWGGEFVAGDGSSPALAAAGVLSEAGGPVPAGKLWVIAVTRAEAAAVDFRFSTSVNTTGDASGFWATDESGYTQSGNSVMMVSSDTIRVYYNSNLPAAPAPAGIVAGFTGISEYADLLCPVTWRI